MKTAVYLTFAVICVIFADACQNTRKANDTTAATTDSAGVAPPNYLAGLSDLCDQNQKAYAIPVRGLPDPQTIPGFKKAANQNAFLQTFLQLRADELSWLTFIAMNWRATEMGTPDSTQCFGNSDGPTVWEHWMPGKRLFVDNDQKPAPWLYGLASAGHPKNSLQEPEMHPFKLKDLSEFGPERHVVPNQYGSSTLYEVFYNRSMYDYIVGTQLYSVKGQRNFTKTFPSMPIGLTLIRNGKPYLPESELERACLPLGSAKDTTFKPGNGFVLTYNKNVGAIMVKSAWTVLTPNEDQSKYHIRRVKRGGKLITLGLVGLHVAHKLAEAPRWMWSTFEHLTNTPRVNGQGKADLKPGVDYLYFDESRNDTSEYNKPPAREKNSLFAKQSPVQIVRLQKRLGDVDQINDQFHGLLAKANPKSVWLNYRLVGTQWPFSDPLPFVVKGDVQPALLANAVMETYHQQKSSCMGCHAKARFLGDTITGYFADFVWGLSLGTGTKQKKPAKRSGAL